MSEQKERKDTAATAAAAAVTGASTIRSGLRVCVLDVARGFTIEATHPLPATTPAPAADGAAAAEAAAAAEPKPEVHYPHDAEAVLLSMPQVAKVEVVYLRPGPRNAIGEIRRRTRHFDVFVNLYDLSDPTGQQIVDFMEENGIAFTGAGSRFYDPPRRDLKTVIRSVRGEVDTPLFAIVTEPEQIDSLPEKCGPLSKGLFVKPEHGYDSVGIDANSLVFTQEDLRARVSSIIDEFGGALVEQYIDGREFSVLVAGSKHTTIEVFPPVEYVFPKDRRQSPLAPGGGPAVAAAAGAGEAIGASARPGPAFITFEDKWGSNFENRWKMLGENDAAAATTLRKIAFKLYEAFDGQGLARFDLRQDAETGRFYVLDINPNCSLFYKDDCTADTIIRETGWSKARFMEFLLNHALSRRALHDRLNAVYTKYDPHYGSTLHARRALGVGDLVYTTEMAAIRVVTRQHADAKWPKKDLETFDQYAWPLGPDSYAIWDEEPKKWRPINHSCDPNCWMQGFDVVARRPIACDEELTLHYSTFAPEIPQFDCWCRSPNCLKSCKPGDWQAPEFIKVFRGHCSPFVEHMITKYLRTTAALHAAPVDATAVTAPGAAARATRSSQYAVALGIVAGAAALAAGVLLGSRVRDRR